MFHVTEQKVLSFNKIIEFVDHQYLWKERNITANWVWPGVPSHTQTCLDIRGVDLVGLRLEQK